MEKPKLFGTNGIRGDAQKLFTNKFCFDIGVSFGKFLLRKNKGGKIAIGMDPRESSERIKSSFLQGLSTTASWEFLNEGIIPTPCLNYFVKEKKLAGGVMITGSHIREEQNGIKFFVEEEEITKDHEKEIENIYYRTRGQQQHQPQKLKIKKDDGAKEIYTKMLLGLAQKPYPSWKVIVDAGNGTQSLIIPKVLEELGLEIFKINCDPRKKLVVRDMEVSGVFEDLAKQVKNKRVDFGVALDADGDRVVFFDEKGNSIPGEYSCSLLARESSGRKVVTPINTSSVVENINKEVIRTKVGVLYVVEAMKKHKANYGFEANGGGISAEVFYGRDGGTTLIKMLNLIKEKDEPLSKIVSELPGFALVKKKIDCPRKLNKRILEQAEKTFKGIKVERIDGLKIWLDEDSWILFRPSGNAPEFRVWTEAKGIEEAEEVVENGLNLVKNVIRQQKI